METTHLQHVQTLLADAAAEHAQLLSELPPHLQASLPVDAQGVTQAIDHLAVVSLLGQSGVRRGAPPAWNCAPDAPPMTGHHSDKRGHRLRTLG